MSPRKSTSSVAEASSHEEEQQAAAESSKTAGSGTDPIETGVNVEVRFLYPVNCLLVSFPSSLASVSGGGPVMRAWDGCAGAEMQMLDQSDLISKR